MDRKVLIRVCGIQESEEPEEQEPIELVVPGQYFFKNGMHYFRYEEYMEDFKDPTLNYIKFSTNHLEVRKQGLINVTMVFEPGKRYVTFYTTPYGTIEMGLSTRWLKVQEEEKHISVQVEYAMDMNDQPTSICTLTLEAFETENGRVEEGVWV